MIANESRVFLVFHQRPPWGTEPYVGLNESRFRRGTGVKRNLCCFSVIIETVVCNPCLTPFPSSNVNLLALIHPNQITIRTLLSPCIKAYARISAASITTWSR